jgi:hypothetical protein
MTTGDAIEILKAKGHKFGKQYMDTDGQNWIEIDGNAVRLFRVIDLAEGTTSLDALANSEPSN